MSNCHPCRMGKRRRVSTKDPYASCDYVCIDNLGGSLEKHQLLKGLQDAGVAGIKVSLFILSILQDDSLTDE